MTEHSQTQAVTCLVNGSLIGFLVILDGNLGSHAPHGMHSTLVAGVDDSQAVGTQEAHRHAHCASA